MIRTSVEMTRVPPTRSNWRSWSTRSDERRRNRGAIHANKGLASTLRTLMYSARNQFLPGACFACNQHRRVGGSDFHDARKDSFQRGRGAHDLLKHEDLIDLLPEGYVFVMKAVFQPLDFFESLLQVGSSLPLCGDIHHRPNKLDDS